MATAIKLHLMSGILFTFDQKGAEYHIVISSSWGILKCTGV